MKTLLKVPTFLLLMYLITTCGQAKAVEAVLAEGVCTYKLVKYECYLVFLEGKYHVILFKGESVIAVYQIVDTLFGKNAMLIYEHGEET